MLRIMILSILLSLSLTLTASASNVPSAARLINSGYKVIASGGLGNQNSNGWLILQKGKDIKYCRILEDYDFYATKCYQFK